MKYLIALVLFSSLCFAAQKSSAMITKIDSVYADSCYQDGTYGVSSGDSARMFHKFDSQFGQLTGNGPQIDMAFKKYKSTNILPIQQGSKVIVWGKKDIAADSSAGQLTFNKYDESLGMLITSSAFILNDTTNSITVPSVPSSPPNASWDYVELSLAGDFVHHATSYFIDAVALVQDTATPTGVVFQASARDMISSYPNPFIGNTTIHFALASGGEVLLSVLDPLGRETVRIDAGYLDSGTHEIPLSIQSPGYYFVRLLVNGQPVGYPLKITSR